MTTTSPPDQAAYYAQVWEIVRQVPYAKVATYGQIARLIPLPLGVERAEYKEYGARWVGNAMAACPKDVPWQRVINAQGKVSKRSGAFLQQQLLEDEGLLFVNDKVSLKTYQWRGPDAPDEPNQLTLF